MIASFYLAKAGHDSKQPVHLSFKRHIFLALACILSFTPGLSGSTATINGTGLQTVKGWGAFPSFFRTDESPTGHASDIFDKPLIQDAIYEIGLTYIRVELRTKLYVSGTQLNDIVLNSAAVDDLVRQLQIARDNGVTDYITACWSPPAVWKDNNSVNGGHLIAANAPYFVNFYIKVLQTLNARGVGLPVAISMQNEPDIATFYDSCIYTDSSAGYALWRQLVVDMRAALNANSMTGVKIFGPECTSTDNDINLLGGGSFGALANFPGLDNALGAYASHTYGEGVWLGMRSGMAAHPKDGWITEWSIYDNRFGTTETGWLIGTMQHLASNFVDLPFNYWTWWAEWNSASAPQSTTLLAGSQNPVYSKRYWVLQRLWNTVRPGWVVHALTCDDASFITRNNADVLYHDTLVDLVSFWKPSGNASVTLLVNKNTTTTSMTVNGLVGARYAAYRSDASSDMVNFASGNVSGGSATLSLNPSSVTLLITSSDAPAAPGGVTTLAQNPGVTVFWPVAYGATSYNVKRSATPGGPYTTIGTTATALKYQDTTATAGTTCYYTVTAVNPTGESVASPATGIVVPYLRTALADAYVRNGTYSGTNYGTAADLLAKLDVAGYTREAFLRFDVSGLAGAQNVKIWLVPASVGGTTYNVNPLQYEFVSSDTWSETGITWSTKPAGSGVTVANGIGGYFAGQMIELDVTARAKAEAGADGLLSLRIYSTVNDANKWVNFAAKEHATTAYRPVLSYTLQSATREPVADAYVRNGVYASTNYGATTDISVKADGTDYAREAFVRFDASGLAGAPSVKLRLVPSSVGTEAHITTLAYEFVSNDTWGESGITWATKPAGSGSLFATITGYAPGQPVEVDVTAQAHAAASGDGLLSVRIYSTIPGSNKWVIFSSKENSSTSGHPVLVY